MSEPHIPDWFLTEHMYYCPCGEPNVPGRMVSIEDDDGDMWWMHVWCVREVVDDDEDDE